MEDPYRAAAGCHALVILTDWDSYRKLDFQKIYKSMAKPAFLFDGRNIVDHGKCFTIGFNVYPIGKPALSHLKTIKSKAFFISLISFPEGNIVIATTSNRERYRLYFFSANTIMPAGTSSFVFLFPPLVPESPILRTFWF